MTQIQILDANFAYELTGKKAPALQGLAVRPLQQNPEIRSTPSASASPALSPVEGPAPDSELHPWLKNTFLGTLIGGAAGTGTAIAVSRFLNKPLNTINKAKVGGIQGVFSGASGAVVAASFAKDRTTGTILGGVTGATVGALQALAFSPSKGKVIMGAITGLVSGAAAGHVTLAWREYQQQKTLQGVDSAPLHMDQIEEDPFDENAPLQLPFPVTF